MKKFTAAAVCAALLISLAGCEKDKEKPRGASGGVPGDKNADRGSSRGGSAVRYPRADGGASAESAVCERFGIFDILPETELTPEDKFAYYYSEELGGMVITDCADPRETRIRIPDTIEGERVVKLEMGKCSKRLTEIIMPDTVIGFEFSDRTKRSIKYMNIPACWEYRMQIPLSPFKSLEAVYIDDGLTYIAQKVFTDCKSLKRIIIPDSVTEIEWFAFQGCSSLASIIIPDGITVIDSALFKDCSSLAGAIIPDGVTRIGGSAFSGCVSLSRIALPESVTSIRGYAFRSCYALMSVNIPESVSEIGEYAFADCGRLKSVALPDGIKHLGKGAFDNCAALTVTYRGSAYTAENMSDLYMLFEE